MTFDEDFRTALKTTSQANPPGPGDFESVRARGRRRRIVNSVAAATGALVVVGAGFLGAAIIGDGDQPNGFAGTLPGSVTTSSVTASTTSTSQPTSSTHPVDSSSTSTSITTPTTLPASAGTFTDDDFYSEGKSRRVVTTDPPAIVDLFEQEVVHVFELDELPFVSDLRHITYGVVFPDGSLLMQAIDPDDEPLMYYKLGGIDSPNQWQCICDGDDPTVSVLIGHHYAGPGVVRLYRNVWDPEVTDPPDTDLVALDFYYVPELDGPLVDFQWRVPVPASGIGVNSDLTKILVEDYGVDPVYGPSYKLLDAATGNDISEGAQLPQAVFDEDGNPVSTPDGARFLSETVYGYILTTWGSDGVERRWTTGSIDPDGYSPGFFRGSETLPFPDGPARSYIACLFWRQSGWTLVPGGFFELRGRTLTPTGLGDQDHRPSC